VTTLLKDREPAAEAGSPLPDGEHVVVPPFACEACGAGMQAGQDWCLDCGTAAPGRLGARPGWRAAFTVVGVTLLLLVGAVAASYAALTGDAQREASKPSSGSGNPVTAQTPAIGQQPSQVTPNDTGPGTTAPPPSTVTPPSTGTTSPVVPPPTTVTPNLNNTTGNTKQTTGNTNNTTNNTKTTGNTTGNTNTKTSGPKPIALATNAATLYDPEKRAGAEFGPPGNILDAKKSTVWDVTVPADGEPLGVGLVVDLGARYALKSLKMSTVTAGFDIELYGAKGTKIPPDILDARWDHLTDRVNYPDGKSIDLESKGDGKVRFVALWFAEAADDQDPRVAIGDVKIFGTK
jgi:hypothetical protein